MSYDTLRVVMSCLAATLTLSGDHIITSAKHSHNVWRSQIHNSKLITSRSPFAKRVISYDTLRVVMMYLRHSLKLQGNHIIAAAERAKCDYAVDLFFHYGSDAGQAIKGGNNLRAAAIGMGVYSSHGVERAHIDGIDNTARLMLAYLLEG